MKVIVVQKVVIGWSEINSNRVELPVNVTEFDKLDNISFNAKSIQRCIGCEQRVW